MPDRRNVPDARARKLVSLVVPVLDEEASVRPFAEAIGSLFDGLPYDWEIVFVDDGSTDTTPAVLAMLTARDPHLRVVELSRNFGKEAALTAGLEFARGDAVIPMDVDMQDPPEVVVEFLERWEEGYEVVCGQRISRDADTRAKRGSAGLFYRAFNRIATNRIEPNVGDFRLLDRQVVDALRALPERNRFMKGLFSWVGFRTCLVPYERAPRAYGRTKFDYWKLWNFALDGITGFSTVPLRVWTYAGLLVAVGAFAYAAYTVAKTLALGVDVPGYASLMVVVLTLGAVQLVSLGVIGEYLGRLYLEAKQRPMYLVRRTAGFDTAGFDRAAGPPAPPREREERRPKVVPMPRAAQ
jgi:glycosyltransferase involved in cell wall biosynthesis